MVPKNKTRVLFLCAHNSARSQMAEGILRARYGHAYEVASAGHLPTEVHPLAVRVMAEIGIDISGHRAKHVRELLGQKFDCVVTLCGDDAPGSCPFFPGGDKYLHAPFPDPARVDGDLETKLSAFRQVRDAIARWIEEVLGPASTGNPR